MNKNDMKICEQKLFEGLVKIIGGFGVFTIVIILLIKCLG